VDALFARDSDMQLLHGFKTLIWNEFRVSPHTSIKLNDAVGAAQGALSVGRRRGSKSPSTCLERFQYGHLRLVHGGFHGGWCYSRVAKRLRAQKA